MNRAINSSELVIHIDKPYLSGTQMHIAMYVKLFKMKASMVFDTLI